MAGGETSTYAGPAKIDGGTVDGQQFEYKGAIGTNDRFLV